MPREKHQSFPVAGGLNANSEAGRNASRKGAEAQRTFPKAWGRFLDWAEPRFLDWLCVLATLRDLCFGNGLKERVNLAGAASPGAPVFDPAGVVFRRKRAGSENGAGHAARHPWRLPYPRASVSNRANARSHTARSRGSMRSMGRLAATIARAAESDRTSPRAMAWTITFPAAVASTGPASTANCVAFAANWFSNGLRLPPPTMCNRSMWRPVTQIFSGFRTQFAGVEKHAGDT